MNAPPFFLPPPEEAAPIAWQAHEELDFDRNIKFTYFKGKVSVRVEDCEPGAFGHACRISVDDHVIPPPNNAEALYALALAIGTNIVNGLLSSKYRTALRELERS